MAILGPSDRPAKHVCGPICSPSPGPMLPIQDAAPDRLARKSIPIPEKISAKTTKQKQ